MSLKSIESHVKFGLDSIDESQTIEVSLKKLVFIYKTFEELISFFHQKGHYEAIEDVHKYLGNKRTGMFSIISEIYYEEFEEIFPDYVKNMLETDVFDNPIPPYYKIKPKS